MDKSNQGPFGSTAEEYHIESNNKMISKRIPAIHQVNLDPIIEELAREAPLHLDLHLAEPIALLVEQESASMSVEDAILQRVSNRVFSPVAMPLSKLAKVLFLANGVRKNERRDRRPPNSRNVPSSGGLGSVEIYCIVLNVADLQPGIYHFDTVHHELRLFKRGHFGVWLRDYACFQYEASEPAAILLLTSRVGRLVSKYGARGYRLALMDTGHVSENIYLSATALDLNVFAFGGFVDDEMNRAIDLDGLDNCTLLCLGIGCR